MIVWWFQAEGPGKFEVRQGSQVLDRVTWESGDYVVITQDGRRVIIRDEKR